MAGRQGGVPGYEQAYQYFSTFTDDEIGAQIDQQLNNATLTPEQRAFFDNFIHRAENYRSQHVNLSQELHLSQQAHVALNQTLSTAQTRISTLTDQLAGMTNHITGLTTQIAHLATTRNTNNSNNLQNATLKVAKPPTFDGTQVYDWLFSVKQYLQTIGLTDPVEQVKFSATLFTGRALTWWRSSHTLNTQPSTFNQLEHALHEAFSDIEYLNKLRNKLNGLKQTKTVSTYIQVFRDTVVQMGPDRPDEETLCHKFIVGLQKDVQLQVAMHNPSSLSAAFTLAERASNVLNYVEGNVKRAQTSAPRSTPTPMELGNIQKGKQPNNMQNNKTNQRTNLVCNYCKKTGHLKRDCYDLKRAQQQNPNSNTKYANLIAKIDELVTTIDSNNPKN